MTINIFVLKGDLNGKIVVVRFFFCRLYNLRTEGLRVGAQKNGLNDALLLFSVKMTAFCQAYT